LLELSRQCQGFINKPVDIRDQKALSRIFSLYQKDIKLIIHTAAQPSHDWAAREPLTDFSINAEGTLVLLEAARRYCPEAVFIFTSTNKVLWRYAKQAAACRIVNTLGNQPAASLLPQRIDEFMPVDHCTHSVFGASKLAADILVQEYGRYFGMKTRGVSMRLPYRSGACRRRAPWIPLVIPYEMRRNRARIQDIRL